jgi:acyl-CoA thioester hydrolase
MHHTDQTGAVYHGTYFDLFEEARTEVFRDLGYTYSDCVEGEGRLMVIVRAACDYRRPAMMDDLLDIRVRISSLTRARCAFRYDVTLAGTGEAVAVGEHVFAFLDVASRRPVSVPPRFVALVGATPDLLVSPEPHHEA